MRVKYLKIVNKIVGESKEELEFDEFFTLVTNPDYENVVELDAIFNVRYKNFRISEQFY